jgi:hypothetical protein
MQTSQLDESGSSSSGQQLFFYMPHLLLGQSSLSQEVQKTENGPIKTQTQGALKRKLPFPAQEEDNKKILKYTSPLQEDIFPDYNLQFLSTSGGVWVHSSTGVKPPGQNSWAPTSIDPSLVGMTSSAHMALYVTENGGGGYVLRLKELKFGKPSLNK